MSNITITEIARRAGVSIGTVDRVLHNRGRVSQKNVDKIQKIIQETGYMPNPHASSLSSKKRYKIAVIMPDLHHEDGFWNDPKSGVDNALDSYRNFNFGAEFFYYNRYLPESFIETTEKILADKESFDGILMAPVLTDLAADFLNKLNGSCPVALFDSLVPNANVLCSMGHDSYVSGHLAGRLMDCLTGGYGSVLIIRTSDSDFHINQRIKGFYDFFKDRDPKPQFEELRLEGGYPMTLYRGVLERHFQQNPEISGIFVTDASSHNPALFLKETCNTKIHLVGYDLTKANLPYIQQGWINFLIHQRSGQQAARGIQALFDHIVLKKEIEAEQNVPMDIIAPENAEYFIYS